MPEAAPLLTEHDDDDDDVHNENIPHRQFKAVDLRHFK
jgi:hypothetical protein